MNLVQKTPDSPPTWIEVAGFKSHMTAQRIELRGLTLLCGANSSGKSSVMQPLLLLKQTLDAMPLDYGALKLDGPNVEYTSPYQFLTSLGRQKIYEFTLGVGLGAGRSVTSVYTTIAGDIDVHSTTYTVGDTKVVLRRDAAVSSEEMKVLSAFSPSLMWRLHMKAGGLMIGRAGPFLVPVFAGTSLALPLSSHLRRLIHLPGLRGNPSRQYRMMAVGSGEPGHFHDRAAATVAQWEKDKDPRLKELGDAMKGLGLTWKVSAKRVDATSIELLVGRASTGSRGSAHDLVSIADVGFGVSQTLPVVVALVAAKPDQMVYIEQPEIHLHPRAQKAMADLIAAAVTRGARMVVETHSEIILTRLQVLIAEEKLAHGDVIAHWFERDPRTGVSKVTHAEPGADGSLGEWPVDFGDVAAEVDREYADAAFDKLEVGAP